MDVFRHGIKKIKSLLARYRKSRPLLLASGIVALLFLVVGLQLGIAAPAGLPSTQYVHIAKGSTITNVAETLSREGVISHPTVFKFAAKIIGMRSGVKAGEYYFKAPAGSIAAAYRLAKGDYGVTPVKVTIPEGMNVYEIGDLLQKNLPNLRSKAFAVAAKPSEGYLFPDTYYFLPGETPADIVETMRANFDEQIKTVDDKIRAFGRPLADVVTMASILEGEARTQESRQIIAGILWKRLEIGMPLQVDSTFEYINGKNTFELTTEDLQADSPYNTYKYKGLPPGPISNPGLDAIIDAVSPIKTKYLYYLSDKNGQMHYAATFDEHMSNIAKYLR